MLKISLYIFEMSLEHIPKIDFAGVVTDTFDASQASINASEYSTSAKNQSLINTLVEIIAVYISDNIATDKNCLIQLSKVLYDANYKLLYKLSQDENFIDKFRQKLVITDSSASSKPALTSADFDRMKNTIVNQVKAAIKDAVKKNKSETDRQINDVAKVFNANKDKPATSPSNVKIPETASDNTTTEQNAVETDDGTIDFNKLEPVLPHTQLTPIWLTSRSVITNSLRKLNINASNRTIALLTVAFKKTTVQSAIDTLTGAIDKNAQAIHRTSAAALTATTVGATAGSVIGRANKPSVFSKNSSFALGAKSALAKVGSVANPFFKKLFTTTKNTIVGTYKITKTILVSIAKLTKAVLVTVGNAIKFTFVTLPKSVFSGVKRINKFINEKVLNNSIVKGIIRFLVRSKLIYIVAGFIVGFITKKIKQAGGIQAVLSNFFTGVKNRIVEGIKTAIDVVWAGIKKPGEVIAGLKEKLRTKIDERLKTTEKEGVENPDNNQLSPAVKIREWLKTEFKANPVEATKTIFIKAREHIREKAKEDENNGKTWNTSVWMCLDKLCDGIKQLVEIIKALFNGIKGIITALYDKSVEIITSITAPFSADFNDKLNKELKKKEKSLASATEEEKLAAAKQLAKEEKLLDNYFSDEHNPFSVKKLRDLYSADKLNISIGDKLSQIKTWFDEKLGPIMSIVKVAIKLSKSRIVKFAFDCLTLLKDDVWIAGIPDPLVKLIAGVVMLAIRGIIAAFKWRKKTQFELGENFKHRFGISVDKAAKESHKKIDHLFNTYKFTQENLEEFRTKNILLPTDISEVEDPNTKERKLIVNVEDIKDRLHLFVETLKSENIKLDEFTKEITTKDENGRILLAEYLGDNPRNTLPKPVADSILSFPLIGISKAIELNHIGLTGKAIYEYNRKLIYMLNLKRGIIKKLSDKVLGELSGSSTIENFNKLLVYASPKYLNKIQNIFKLPTNLTGDNENMSSKLLKLDTITARQEFKLFDYDPMKSIKTSVRDAQDQRVKHDHETEDDYRHNPGDYHQTLGSGSNLFALAVKGISNSHLHEISNLNLLTIDEAAQVKNFQREKLNSGDDLAKVLSPTNGDDAYIVKSAEDVLAVMLSQAGIKEDRINKIITDYKARGKDHQQLFSLSKKLYQALVISNNKIESQADYDTAARSAK